MIHKSAKQTLIDYVIDTTNMEKNSVKKVVIASLILSAVCLISNICYQTGMYVGWILLSLFILGVGQLSLRYYDREEKRKLQIIEEIFGDDVNKDVSKEEAEEIGKIF